LIYAALPGSYVAPTRLPAVIDNADIDWALTLAPQDRVGSAVVPPPATGGSGGGAFGLFWLMALATAAICLGATRGTRLRR